MRRITAPCGAWDSWRDDYHLLLVTMPNRHMGYDGAWRLLLCRLTLRWGASIDYVQIGYSNFKLYTLSPHGLRTAVSMDEAPPYQPGNAATQGRSGSGDVAPPFLCDQMVPLVLTD